MCRGDTTLITFGWVPNIKLPQPDFTLKHKCVNWDRLMDWARENAINVFEEGMLMHPTMGMTLTRRLNWNNAYMEKVLRIQVDTEMIDQNRRSPQMPVHES